MEEIILSMDTQKLYPDALRYMAKICGYERAGSRASKSRDVAMKIFSESFEHTKTHFLIQPFQKTDVTDGAFVINGQDIPCRALKHTPLQDIVAGYLFMFHAPMPDLTSRPVSEAYYADSWETSLVDAGRDVLKQTLLERERQIQNRDLFITDTLAPGMSGMPVASIRSIFKIMDNTKAEITLLDSGMMNPVKSFAGIFLILEKAFLPVTADCSECLSDRRHCIYCKHSATN